MTKIEQNKWIKFQRMFPREVWSYFIETIIDILIEIDQKITVLELTLITFIGYILWVKQ